MQLAEVLFWDWVHVSLLSRAASAERRRGVEEKAGTSPIESHFGARLIYFFLLLVRMQMVASHRPELFPTPGLSVHVPLARSLRDLFVPTPMFPAPAPLSLSLSHQYSSHLSRTDCPGNVMAQSSEPSNEKPQNSGTGRPTWTVRQVTYYTSNDELCTSNG